MHVSSDGAVGAKWLRALPHKPSHGKIVFILRVFLRELPLSLTGDEVHLFTGHDFRVVVDSAADGLGFFQTSAVLLELRRR